MLRQVTILRGETSVEVHIEASGPVKPVARMFSQPVRIVVDLAGVGYDGSRALPVNSGDVEGVRVALFRAEPPVTRVVVDLARRRQYRLLPAGSTVILAIDTTPKPALAAQPAQTKAPTSTAPPPAVPPAAMEPTSASQARLQPPPMASPPTAPYSAVSEVSASHPTTPNAGASEAPAQPEVPAATQSAPLRVTPPAAPTVSAKLPQVPTIPVPASSAQSSGEEETTPHQAAKAQKPGVVRSVTVLRGKEAIEVHIEASKPLRASASTLSNPERIIIDLANVRLAHPRRILVNAADVQAVNASLYLVNPLVTRVVVDLARPHSYHVQAYGNSLIIRIETDEIKTAGSQPVQ